mmetsp:Transcript_9145/g.14443  ORF Transcript_9145/g.14443 Transcript_9145/m.14443 type:complete len:380 (+) Transcript_9145:1014-2153(+)
MGKYSKSRRSPQVSRALRTACACVGLVVVFNFVAWLSVPSRNGGLKSRETVLEVGLAAEGGFVPGNAPRRTRKSVDVSQELAGCTRDDAERNSLQRLLQRSVHVKRCENRVKFGEFLCGLQCDRDEPELEESFKAFRTSRYSAEYLFRQCRSEVFTALIWIHNNKPSFYICGPHDHVKSRSLFSSTRTLLTFLLCMVDVPDVIFGIDQEDWAVPVQTPREAAGWLQPLPGVVRYTGTPSHPSVLIPTNAFVKATTHCRMEDNDIKSRAQLCRSMDSHSDKLAMKWEDKKRVVFWRGSSTGVPLAENIEEYLPRPALVRKFYKTPNFDVGFTGGPPPARFYKPFFFVASSPSCGSGGILKLQIFITRRWAYCELGSCTKA